MDNHDWSKLHFGRLRVTDIKPAIDDPAWQAVRLDMKNSTTDYKYERLVGWLEDNDYSETAKIQVTNYLNALSRGGIIKPEQYQK